MGMIQRLFGGACLLLSAASLLFAAGPAHKLIRVAVLAEFPAELLLQSAVYYAFCQHRGCCMFSRK